MLLPSAVFAQKIANFSCGTKGTESYEEYSFWIRNNGRAEIYYHYGKYEEEVQLVYAGRSLIGDRPCFKVRFPDGYEVLFAPKGQNLKATDNQESYNRLLFWQYEDANAEFCAKDETEAITLIRLYFM